MGYTNQTFIDLETIVKAENFNHIEDGIIAVEGLAEQAKTIADTAVVKPDEATEIANRAKTAADEAKNTAESKQDMLVSGTTIKTLNGMSLLGSGDIDIDADIPTDVIQNEVSKWLDQHPEATTTIGDGAVSVVKLDNTIRNVLYQAGLEKAPIWNLSMKSLNGTIATNDNKCACSNLILIAAGDQFTVADGAKLRYRYTYLGQNGDTYDASKSHDAAWLDKTITFEHSGYYRITICFYPTSTTVITDANLPDLLAMFSFTTTAVRGIDGTCIDPNSIPASKFTNDVWRGRLTIAGAMEQACINGFSFGHSVTTAPFWTMLNNHIVLGNAFSNIKAKTPSVTAQGLPTATDAVKVDKVSDICVVDDELWCFVSGSDDRSDYAVVWRMKFDPISGDFSPSFFWCNFGHANAVNYNPVTDCIIMGNGSADYELENKIYIMERVSEIKALPNGSIVDFADYGIEIDASGYDFGAKLNVVWANIETNTYSYRFDVEYIPNRAFAYADDCNRMYQIALGYGTNKYAYGTYVQPSNGRKWNGTFAVLARYQTGDVNETIGNPGSYTHCGQGGDALAGEFFMGLGHSAKWWDQIRFTGSTTFDRKTTWIPSFSHEKGTVNSVGINGIAVTAEYLILLQGSTIYYLPR